MLKTFGPHDCIENFRMRKETFVYLCNAIRHVIIRHNKRFRQAISVEKGVGINLWCLATPCEYRILAHLFGVARSTVSTIVHETCEAVVLTLMKTYIKFPAGEELRKVVDGFEGRWGFPQCVGAIDCSHIPISATELNDTDYYNRKGWYSMIVQAIVDHNYLFRDICVGWPGSVHDARVFVNSAIYKITEGNILSGMDRTMDAYQVPLCIVSGSAYPIRTWLMKPFSNNTSLDPRQNCFNYSLSRACIVVENAFGLLKER